MLKGRQDVRVLPFPGIPDTEDDIVEVGVRVLLDNEVDDARLEATQYLIGKAKAMRIDYGLLLHSDPELLQREIQRQLVYRAFVQPEPEENGEHKSFFPSPQAVRQLDAVIVETLDEIYDDQQEHVNPLTGMSDEAVRERADTLGEGRGAEAILNSCDAPTLRTLVRILASRLSSLQTGK